jgi:deoxyribonuclease-4
MKQKTHLLFGAHMSIAGEISLAIERGESIGCTAIQIFTKSNRQWKAKELATQDTNAFKAAWYNSSIKSVITHATYLINIGSPNNELAEKSVMALTEELNRCNDLSIPYLVLHPGSHSNTDVNECLKRISANLDRSLEKSNSKTSILLETMAGQGTGVGHTFEQIATIIESSHHKSKIGVCFDTCHAFAAGYDFRTKTTYKNMWENFDKTIGLHKLHAIHVNDSKGGLGSRVDRHADIGEGKIGLEAFKLLFNDPRFVAIPKVLETPRATIEDYEKNMAVVRSLIT